MSTYQPYTYLIGWSNLDRWYYGSRTTELFVANPSDLWTKYFTSSEVVHRFRKEHGEPDIIRVRRVFQTRDEALIWEAKVLRKLKVKHDVRWLNESVGGKKGFCHLGGMTGRRHSEETKELIRTSRKAKGEDSGFYGAFWITNGKDNDRTFDVIPDGWRRGMSLGPWINDGKNVKRLKPGQVLPSGWKMGRK